VGNLNYDIALAGWNPYRGAYDGIGVHHPNGDVKKISFTDELSIDNYPDVETNNRDHFKVVWNKGITAKGSSGSALFTGDHYIIGQLHGGYSYCKPTYNKDTGEFMGDKDSPDYYGRLDYSFFRGKLNEIMGGNEGYPTVIKPQTSYSLRLEIISIPKQLSTDNDFKLEATSLNGVGKITWTWIINKSAEDFGYYPNDANKREAFNQTTSNRKSTVGPLRRSNKGNYIVYLSAIDENLNRGEKTIYLSFTDDMISECIAAFFNPSDCSQQYYFPKGSKVKFTESSYIIQNQTQSNNDACHNRTNLNYPGIWFPKYDGISEVFWIDEFMPSYIYRGEQFFYYYATIETVTNSSIDKVHYSSQYCYDLKTPGSHKIGFCITGGYCNYDNLRPVKPLLRHSATSARIYKNIFVVDCDRAISISNASAMSNFYINSNEREIGYGTIEIKDNVIIQSGETYENIEAFQSIILKPGVHIKSGAKFSAKVKPCPSISNECNCSDLRANISENPTATESFETIDKISIYPNPTTGLLYISQPPSNVPVAMQIYDTAGKIQLEKNDIRNLHSIDISSFQKGIYLVKIISEEFGNTTNKIILK
jgi:hypothetical protein